MNRRTLFVREMMILGIGLSVLAEAGAGEKARPPSPAERRMALLQRAAKGAAAIPALTAALKDENRVVRRRSSKR